MNQKAKQEKEDFELQQKAIKAALVDFIKTPGGKLWIRNIAQDCNVFQQIFSGNSAVYYNEGRRDVALSILKDAKDADPDVYAEIIKEIRL